MKLDCARASVILGDNHNLSWIWLSKVSSQNKRKMGIHCCLDARQRKFDLISFDTFSPCADILVSYLISLAIVDKNN